MDIKIGTRRSRLAVIQARLAEQEILKAFPDIETKIVYINTRGDKILNKPLSELGGKGIFVSEIEKKLQNGEIDIAVHSAKDLPVVTAQGLEISCVLKRGNPSDVIVTNKNCAVKNAPEFIMGTGSLRRKAIIQKLYPKVTVSQIRGNVDTRLDMLKDGKYGALVLASSGLSRIGMLKSGDFDFKFIDTERFPCAPCQGIIAIESRTDDFTKEVLSAVNHRETFTAFETERRIMTLLNADCSVPLGAYCRVNGDNLTVFASKDWTETVSKTGPAKDYIRLSEELISEL